MRRVAATDETEHRVDVSAFQIAEAEVTQKQWKAVMGKDRSHCFESGGCADDLPVQQISWRDAIEFVNKLSRREGLSSCYVLSRGDVVRQPSCTGYRLPTEAEWEYACRAGSQVTYGRGVDASALSRYARYGKVWSDGTVAVKNLKPNAWGLYGMHGNVWEWVWDWYGRYETTVQNDPVGAARGPGRSLRGGAFNMGAKSLRCAGRLWGEPGKRLRINGLRVVRNVTS